MILFFHFTTFHTTPLNNSKRWKKSVLNIFSYLADFHQYSTRFISFISLPSKDILPQTSFSLCAANLNDDDELQIDVNMQNRR